MNYPSKTTYKLKQKLTSVSFSTHFWVFFIRILLDCYKNLQVL